MKKNLLILLPLFIFTVVLVECDKEDGEMKKASFYFGDIFTVKMNEFVVLTLVNSAEKDNTLDVHFKEVLFDNRCPTSDCHLCYGSRADIEISILHQNKTFDIPLTVPGCFGKDNNIDMAGLYKDTLGYQIHILRLSPYPEVSIDNVSDYELRLKIIKL